MAEIRNVSWFLLLILLLFLLGAINLFAQAPDSLSFQGRLENTLGEPLDSAGVSMTFKLYKGATAVWTETQSVDVVDGVFNVLLGKVTPMDTVRFDTAIDLGIKLDGEPSEMSPRTPLAGAAYARALPGFYTYYKAATNALSYNVVGGDPRNSVAADVSGATISGGGGTAFGTPSPNIVTGRFGTIGGGYDNSVVGFGATISGGRANDADGDEVVIGGGIVNSAVGLRSTIGGGQNNTASARGATVGGGRENTAGAEYSTAGGGRHNEATGLYSMVGGGYYNQASTAYATVPGGYQNYAHSRHSVAMGYRANPENLGSFVWQDSSGTSWLQSSADNQFLARASGGFKFLTSAASTVTDAGAELAAGSGTWADLSSVTTKTAFRDIDTRQYLDRLASLRLREWSYKTEDPSITHVGPMAEDFHAAFGLGHNATSITTVDASGVAMAAIQALYELVKEQQAEIRQLRSMIDEP